MKFIKLNIFLSIILLTSLISEYSEQSKDETKDTTLYWEISNPNSEGIDPTVLDSIHQDIEDGKYGLIDHFLVIRKGKVVFDKQYNQDYEIVSKNYDTTRHQYNYNHPDWPPFFNYPDLHSLQSVSKSITSLLLGIAIDADLTIHLDSSILQLFTDYEFDQTDKRKNSIILRNLLTMQSGIK